MLILNEPNQGLYFLLRKLGIKVPAPSMWVPAGQFIVMKVSGGVIHISYEDKERFKKLK
jgi:hypothetical protein